MTGLRANEASRWVGTDIITAKPSKDLDFTKLTIDPTVKQGLVD